MAKKEETEAHKERRLVPWGILALRLVLGGILVSHGLLRVIPSLAENGSPSCDPFSSCSNRQTYSRRS